MSKLKIALIGVGNMGKHHARVLSELSSQIELKYIVDLDQGRGLKFADYYKCNYLPNFKDLPTDTDAAIIVVSTPFHFTIAANLMARGIHVFVEKPLTQRLEEADELIRLSKDQKLVLQVGHIERFNPCIQVIKNIIKDPYLIEIQRLNPLSGRITDTGVIMDLQIHDIDLAIYLTESEVVNIQVMTKNFEAQESLAITQLEFANGCLVNLATSRVTHKKIRKIGVSQKECFIEGDMMRSTVDLMRHFKSDFAEKSTYSYRTESSIEQLYVKPAEPLKNELLDFVGAINESRSPLVSGEDGYKALEIAQKILQCAQRKSLSSYSI